MLRVILTAAVLVRLSSAQETAEPSAKLEHARQVNLERVAKLPNFVADETAIRYKSRHVDPPQWQYSDTIQSEISVRGADFRRQHTLLNGKPWNKPFPYFNWSVQFGGEIRPLFDTKCPTTIEPSGREELHGKPALVYRFTSKANGCFGSFTIRQGYFGVLSNPKRNSPPRSGRFFIDDPGGNLVRFEQEAHEFPKGFGADPMSQIVTWDYIQIGDVSYLLPVSMEIFGGFSGGHLWHVLVEYKNHRHFEAASSVSFE